MEMPGTALPSPSGRPGPGKRLTHSRLVEPSRQRGGRLEPPGALEAHAALSHGELGQPREHGRPAAVVIGDEIDFRPGADEPLLLVDAFQKEHDALAIFLQSRESLATHFERGRTVPGGLYDLGQLTGELAELLPFHGSQV